MSKNRRILGSLTSDLALKLACLFLGLVVWLHVQSQRALVIVKPFTVTLSETDLPADLVVTRRPQNISVTAEGTEEQIRNLDTTAVSAVIDLSNAEPSDQEREYPVRLIAQDTNVNLALGRRTVMVLVERLERIEAQVEVRTINQIPEGLQLVYNGASVHPAQISLEGPESQIRQVKTVRTLFDLSLLRPNMSFPGQVVVLSENDEPLPGVRAEPDRVTISPNVSPAPASRRLLVMPNWRGQLPVGHVMSGYDMTPPQVLVRGRSELLATLTTLETEPIDISTLTRTTTLSARVVVPNGVSAETSRVSIRIVIQERPVATQPPPDPDNP
jgi:YbbR domain-containing protein